MNTYTYPEQMATVRMVLNSKFIHGTRLGIDVGANRGAWTVQMAAIFDNVVAFEPGNLAYAVLQAETDQLDNVFIRKHAVFSRTGRADLRNPKGGTGSRGKLIEMSDAGEVLVAPLDSFHFRACDFLKIDVEGAEYDVLLGAEKTIRRCRPTLCLEMKERSLVRFGHSEAEVRRWLVERNYKQVFKRWCDEVFIPGEKLHV